ncbi:uncharacterized protein UDID_02165 [Ustilago sp. UG-2017a]|nr:uncharacterized protein UDID_02165 [Ustilago sp. UG-2017a]
MCFNSLTQTSPSTSSDSTPPPHPLAQPPCHTSTSLSGVMPHEGSIRKRVVRACEVCRRKKVKCNGQKPCSHCVAFAEQCIYVDVKDRSAYSRRYVESLEMRLERLERAWAIAFESGGCMGTCRWRDGKDIMRRASDPGAGASTSLQMQWATEALNPLTSPTPQHTPNGLDNGLVAGEWLNSQSTGVHPCFEGKTAESWETETLSSTSETHNTRNMKRRLPEEARLAPSLSNDSNSAGQLSSSKRIRSATLPRHKSLVSASSISRSETAPPTHDSRKLREPPIAQAFRAPQAFRPQGAIPSTFSAQSPSPLTNGPIQWSDNGHGSCDGVVMPSPFLFGTGLSELWRDQTSVLSVLPSQSQSQAPTQFQQQHNHQHQHQQQHPEAKATQLMPPPPLEPNQEEIVVGLLQEFMNQQRH